MERTPGHLPDPHPVLPSSTIFLSRKIVTGRSYFLFLFLTKKKHTAKFQKPKEGAVSMVVDEVNGHYKNEVCVISKCILYTWWDI